MIDNLGDQNPRVVSNVLEALGELVKVGRTNVIEHVKELLPYIIETLQDQSSSTKRETALRTLGNLIQHTGYVIEPFLEYIFNKIVLYRS